MGVETLATLTAAVMRECRNRVGALEIQADINNAIDFVVGQTNWEFLLKQTNINVNPLYQTGTIAATDHTNVITLTGGTWDTSWKYKYLYLGSSLAPYPITAFTSPTTATLGVNLNLGMNLTASTYTIYQDTYPLPSDMSFGRELIIINTLYRRKLFKPHRFTAENRNAFTQFFFNNLQFQYSDAGYDDTDRVYLIKMFPIPSSVATYPIIYYRQIPYLTQDADTTIFPREFDQAIVYWATHLIKMRYSMPGWKEAGDKAARIVRDMRKMAQTGPAYDFYVMANSYGSYDNNSSITDGLAIIGPNPAPVI